MLGRTVTLTVLLAAGLCFPAKAQHASAIAELRRECGAEIQAAYAEAAPRGMSGPQQLENWFIQALTGNVSADKLRQGQIGYAREAPTLQQGYQGGWRFYSCALGVAARLKGGPASAPAKSPQAAPKAAVPAAKLPPAPTLSPQQQLRDNAVDAQLAREAETMKRSLAFVEPCKWRPPNEAQDPCVKSNSEKNIIIIDRILYLLELKRGQISPAYYSKVKNAYEGGRNSIMGDCLGLASSSTPCGQPVPNSVYGKKSRIIARDGRHALACVKLVSLSSGNSSTSGGGRVLSNQCEGPVEIGWCSMGGECQRNAGNSWTVQPGRSWPVEAKHEVRWGACHGANTIHGEEGSQGLNFTCSKPDK